MPGVSLQRIAAMRSDFLREQRRADVRSRHRVSEQGDAPSVDKGIFEVLAACIRDFAQRVGQAATRDERREWE
eukprot:7033230-Alexandrium_andersonii.AAC.1